MPNHFHGILMCVGAGSPRPDSSERKGGETPKNQGRETLETGWKPRKTRAGRPRPYEHIVRNEHDLLNIRRYIAENPLKWEMDENHPANFAR